MGRPLRACECSKCRLYSSAGYRMISYTSWRLHNGTSNIKEATPAPGQQSILRARSQETVLPLLQQEYPVQDHDDYSDGGGLPGPSDDEDEMMPLWDDHGASPIADEQELQGDDSEHEDDTFDDDSLLDEDLASDGRPVVRIWGGDRHHELHPAIRNAYTAIAFAKMTGTTDRSADKMLEQLTATAQLALESIDPQTREDLGLDQDSLEDVRTSNWRTAMSRLGVLGDEYMSRFICCPSCWWLVPLDKLGSLEGPVCGAPLGDDLVCEEEIYSSINNVRTPLRVAPYINLTTWIALWNQDVEFREAIQHWRTCEDDTGGMRMPLSADQPYIHPDDKLFGIADGSAWRAQLGNVRRIISEEYDVIDEQWGDDVPVYRHVSQHSGLQIILGCDWFRVKNMPDYSVGAVFACVANLPRHLMFKKRYTALLAVIPGPEEPSLTYLNRILEPVIKDFKKAEGGFHIHVSNLDPIANRENQDTMPAISARLLFTAADLPATKKIIGAVGHSHGTHPCHHCGITLAELSSPPAYAWRSLPAKELSAAELLGQSFRHEDTLTSAEAREIEDAYGIRHSVLTKLIGMEHSKSAPLDHLHNLYLGLVKFFINTLTDNAMFDGEVDGESRESIFASIFNRADYPGHIGKLPAKVTKQMLGGRAAGLKADQWKRISQLLPHALAVSWRKEGSWEIDDEDLDGDDVNQTGTPAPNGRQTPEPSQVPPVRGRSRAPKKKPRRSRETEIPFRRNRKLWYDSAISLCAGIRVLDSHAISLSDAESATEDIAICARTMISLGAKLTINWHNAMHYPLLFHVGLERNNGCLAKVKHNMKERDIPSTLMRAWIREARLLALLYNPAPEASATELEAIAALLADKSMFKGTVMMNEMRTRNTVARLPKPMKISPVNLRKYGPAYESLLTYVQQRFPEYDFVGRITVGDRRPCLPVSSERYLLYTHVVHQGYKFCSALYTRTRRDQFALADVHDNGSRDLVKIRLFLDATLVVGGRQPLRLRLALVDTYETLDVQQPWSYRNIDLGYRAYHDSPAGRAFQTRFIPLSSLQASVIVSRTKSQAGPLLTVVSCDREGQEPEFWLNSDDPQDDALGMADEDEDAEGETDHEI